MTSSSNTTLSLESVSIRGKGSSKPSSFVNTVITLGGLFLWIFFVGSSTFFFFFLSCPAFAAVPLCLCSVYSSVANFFQFDGKCPRSFSTLCESSIVRLLVLS